MRPLSTIGLTLVCLLAAILAQMPGPWYFVDGRALAAQAEKDRTPALQGLDGSSFECFARVELWRQTYGDQSARCYRPPIWRHWLNVARRWSDNLS